MNAGWIAVPLAVLLLAILVMRLLSATTVYEFERGLQFKRGRFAKALGPGMYWQLRPLSQIYKIDIRPANIAVAGQEILSADGVAVKASVAATYHVADAERALIGTSSYAAAIHTELQLALRAVITGLPVEQLLEKRPELSTQLKAIAEEKLRPIGIQLDDAAIRDITFPGELKKIFSQVVKARQEGLAALEKARGETAALRNLANAAQMIQRNPQLMQLRLLQVLSQQPGNTVVLGVQPSGQPIPIRESAQNQGELPLRGETTEEG
jgi:regulator of protease activity HflC (stomatin/prohibitin superfamily)